MHLFLGKGSSKRNFSFTWYNRCMLWKNRKAFKAPFISHTFLYIKYHKLEHFIWLLCMKCVQFSLCWETFLGKFNCTKEKKGKYILNETRDNVILMSFSVSFALLFLNNCNDKGYNEFDISLFFVTLFTILLLPVLEVWSSYIIFSFHKVPTWGEFIWKEKLVKMVV